MKFVFRLMLLLVCTILLTACHPASDLSDPNASDNSPPAYQLTGSEASAHSADPIRFSLEPGVYNDTVLLTLTCSDPSLYIRYTLDCAASFAEFKRYEEALPMQYDKANADSDVTVYNIRAICVNKSGQIVGSVVSASYLFPKNPERFTTKVVSIVSKESNLYGETGILEPLKSGKPTFGENGILYWAEINKGRRFERPAEFELFDVDGTLLTKQRLGIRVAGSGSRNNDQRNLRFFARKDYTPTKGKLDYPLFPTLLSEHSGRVIESYDTFLLRGGSSNFIDTMITHNLSLDIMKDSANPAARYDPVACFVNGRYYGLMFLMEDYNPYFFESHYGVDSQDIITVTMRLEPDNVRHWILDDGTKEQMDEWEAVWAYLANTDFSDEKEYERACMLLDMRSFIEYTVHECYVYNSDWPHNNQRVWRYTGVEAANALTDKAGGYDPDAAYAFDGRWRFVYKDLDYSLGLYGISYTADFFAAMRASREVGYYDVFKCLMLNEGFRKDFYLYLCEYVSTRGSVESMLSILNNAIMQISVEMQYHTEKYAYKGDSLDHWNHRLEVTRTFIENRLTYVLRTVRAYSAQYDHDYSFSHFDIAPMEGGHIVFNGGSFTGGETVYTLMDETLPIRFVPDEGYILDTIRYDGGPCDENRIRAVLAEGTLTVTFRKISEDAGEPTQPITPMHPLLNEIGHSATEAVNGHDFIELYNPTDAPIALRGYTISNGMESYTLPNLTVEAHGYRVILCSGTDDGGIYAPFTLSGSDTVTLSDPDGNRLDSIRLLTRSSTAHLGRYPDGGEWTELTDREITPSMANLHTEKEAHFYHESVCNTVCINGTVLYGKDTFYVGEDGTLYTTIERLKAYNAERDQMVRVLWKDFGITSEQEAKANPNYQRLYTVYLSRFDYRYIDPDALNRLTSALYTFGDREISLKRLFEQSQSISKINIYYVSALNSYIIQI